MARRVVSSPSTIPPAPSNPSTPSTPSPKKKKNHEPKPERGEGRGNHGCAFESDPNLIAKLTKGIREGLHPNLAAARAGVSWRAFLRYRQYARMGLPRYQPIEDAIRKASAEFAADCVKHIRKAGLEGVGGKDPDWKALVQLLKVNCPDEWKDKVEVTSPAVEDSEAQRLIEHVRKLFGDEKAEELVRSFLAQASPSIFGAEETDQAPTGD